MSRDKRQRLSWGISIVFHVVFLLLVAASGLLSLVYADKGAERPFEVTLETASPDEGESESESTEASSPSAAAPPDIDLPTTKQEWIAKEYSPQEAPAKEKNSLEKKMEDSASTMANGSSIGGTEQGNSRAGSSGTKGKESSKKSGNGSGNGTGSGNDAGNSGISEEQRHQPKEPPVLLSAKSPRYPNSLRNAGVEGKVRVRLLVGTGGQVETVEVIESSGQSAMDSAAVEAAYGYRFRPAKNVWNEPVRAYITRRISFSLQ